MEKELVWCGVDGTEPAVVGVEGRGGGRVRLKFEVVGDEEGGVTVRPEVTSEGRGTPMNDLNEEAELGRDRALERMSEGRAVALEATLYALRAWREVGWDRGGAETAREQTLAEWPGTTNQGTTVSSGWLGEQ